MKKRTMTLQEAVLYRDAVGRALDALAEARALNEVLYLRGFPNGRGLTVPAANIAAHYARLNDLQLTIEDTNDG